MNFDSDYENDAGREKNLSIERRKITDRRILYCSVADFFELKADRNKWAIADFIDKCQPTKSKDHETRVTIELSFILEDKE